MDGTVEAPVRRRSRRDWFVDACFFLAAVGFGVVMSGIRLGEGTLTTPLWLFNLDQLTGVAGCAALWLRRRHPVGLAVALVAVSSYSELVAGAMLVALFTVAVHRPPRVTGFVFGLSLVAAAVFVIVRPEPGEPPAALFILGAALQGAAVGWGLFVHHRRRLVAAQRERAERAVTEARLRAEQAQHQAREAIAREIHDVLGHRLSLLSVHAGALEYRPDAPPEDIARAAKIIRESAHQALQDLREVIGVLRAPVGELPQPTLADIPQLVEESVRAGMHVSLAEEVDGVTPDTVGRTAYRVVQEALTNAHKHAAPESRVRVRLTGAPGQGLTVEIHDSPRTSRPATAETDGPETTAPQGATSPAAVTPHAPRRGESFSCSAVSDADGSGTADSGTDGPGTVTCQAGGSHTAASPGSSACGDATGLPVSDVNAPGRGGSRGAVSPAAGVFADTFRVAGSRVAGHFGHDTRTPPGGVGGGSGQGLIGLAERVGLAGGRLEYGPRPEGGWRLAAWLPWPS